MSWWEFGGSEEDSLFNELEKGAGQNSISTVTAPKDDSGSWFDSGLDFVKSFNTGGSNHDLWNKIEDTTKAIGTPILQKHLTSTNTVEQGENVTDMNKSVTIIQPKTNGIDFKDPKILIGGLIGGLLFVMLLFKR